MPELSDADREYIRLTEEYRYEVQRTLGNKPGRLVYLVDKVAMPVGLLMLTALLSGLVVPYILRVDDDQRQLLDLKARLINDVVGESTAAQMALVRLNEQQCDYWNAMLTIASRKRALQRRYDTLTPEERQTEFATIAEDRRRENDARIAADRQYAESRFRLAAATERLRHTMSLYYGDPRLMKAYSAALEAEHFAAETLVHETHQDKAAATFAAAHARIRDCATEDVCAEIVSAAISEIETLRSAEPKFMNWQKASEDLAVYVSKHDPVIGSRAILAGVLRGRSGDATP
jgi:hypothetical protein